MVVIVGDGAEWIWNRAAMFVRRCEILDFWHALEHAWTFARLRFGEDSAQADRWVHQIAEDLRAGKVQEVIAALKRLRPNPSPSRAGQGPNVYGRNITQLTGVHELSGQVESCGSSQKSALICVHRRLMNCFGELSRQGGTGILAADERR